MPDPLYYTAAMALAMPEDGNKYEVVHGELLVSPSPRPLHQLVLARLALHLGKYLESQPIGTWFPGGDISWSGDTLVIPDLFVVGIDEARTLDWEQMKHLLLVVEVLSPSSGRHDRFTKRRLYQEVGIPLYWLVDAEAKVVEAWTPDAQFPAVEVGSIAWHPAGASAPLTIDLIELFAAM